MAKKFLDVDLEHIKTNKPEELRKQGIRVKNLEQSFGGPIKIHVYVTRGTYMYAAMDPYVYIMTLFIIMKMSRSGTLKYTSTNRVGVVLEYLHKQMILKRKLDPRLIQGACISHEDKSFLESKVALKMTLVRDIPSFYKLEQLYEWDMKAMQVMTDASWETLRAHKKDFETLDAFYNENYSIKHILSLDRCVREATYVARMGIMRPRILFDDRDTLKMAIRKQPGSKKMYNLYIRSNSISKMAYYEVMNANSKGTKKLQIGVIDKVKILSKTKMLAECMSTMA